MQIVQPGAAICALFQLVDVASNACSAHSCCFNQAVAFPPLSQLASKACSTFQAANTVTATPTVYATTVTVRTTLTTSATAKPKSGNARRGNIRPIDNVAVAVQRITTSTTTAAMVATNAASCEVAAASSACSCLGVTASTVTGLITVTATKTATQTVTPAPTAFYIQLNNTGFAATQYLQSGSDSFIHYGPGVSSAAVFAINAANSVLTGVTPNSGLPVTYYRLNCYDYPEGIACWSAMQVNNGVSLTCSFDDSANLQCTCHDIGNNSDAPCVYFLCPNIDGGNSIFLEQNVIDGEGDCGGGEVHGIALVAVPYTG